MKAIYKRELKSYFDSMIGYIFVAFVVAFTGIYFMAYNLFSGYPYFSYALGSTFTIMLVAVPILTMKCFAEEKKTGTDQLLLTSPVSLTKIVLGKYLAMMTVYAIPTLIFCICPLIIKANGESALLSDYLSIFTYFILGGVFIAIGMFISTLTESQIISAVVTFGVMFLLILWQNLMQFLPPSLSGILSCVDIMGPFENFSYNQMFDLTGWIAYGSAIFVFIFLSVQSLAKRRWS